MSVVRKEARRNGLLLAENELSYREGRVRWLCSL